ncbi:MAG: helix-turn-helix transcriptional regulator [Acidobacteria bacterium]|nr:helix-turn-helix transcriptional regulator [Acidobacteriota bacterium]
MRASPGEQLRKLREGLGLSMRDVEMASEKLAGRYGESEYLIPISRLSSIETGSSIPSIHRLYALSVTYHVDIRALLLLYEIDLANVASDSALIPVPKTHLMQGATAGLTARIPVRVDPAFDINRTSNLGRLIEKWGVAPLAFLQEFAGSEYTYGYIGARDFFMYPLLLPGSFIQVDEHRTEILTGPWRTELERPIYFVETHEGYTCCWLEEDADKLLLRPHHLSPERARILRRPRDVELIGQVVGLAMRLDCWPEPERVQKLLQ